MKLEFEQVIYWPFLIISKKRYMYNTCDRDGNISKKVGKKGVLLARRDNSKFIRDIYEKVVTKIFEKEKLEDVLYFIIEELNKLCCDFFRCKDFVITKSIGDVGDLKPIELFDNEKKVKIGDYTVPKLPNDKKERDKQLVKKKAVNEKDFYLKSLPAQVQLGEKMKRRGQRAEPGSRLEYVIVQTEDNFKDKQSEKLEDVEYFKEHSDVIKIDHMYYLKLLINPLDQILFVGYKQQEFTMNQYKYRVAKIEVLDELKNLFKPKLKFV
jgi:DNA polymerase elongation subunit (family B)